jgi:hypothetical protein
MHSQEVSIEYCRGIQVMEHGGETTRLNPWVRQVIRADYSLRLVCPIWHTPLPALVLLRTERAQHLSPLECLSVQISPLEFT